jgi:cytoskeleton protein RodZ
MSLSADNTADKMAASSSVGERLKAARDRQGLTLQKIGEDLHLDLWVLEAMEENRFRALGAPVYARGHLRKYAQLLGLDVESVLVEYESTHTGPVAPSLVPNSVEHTPIAAERAPGWSRMAVIAIVLAVVLAAAGAALWWWRTRPSQHLRPQATSVAAPTVSDSTLEIAAAPVAPEPDAADLKVSESTTAGPGATTAATPADGLVARLRLQFSADSWIEIYDATGARLLFDYRTADTARTVTGVPPFKVLLGNYTGVELTLDGQPVAVTERSRYGATARFRVLRGGSTLASWGS